MMSCGSIHLFGDHIDTDVILPGKYLNLYTPQDLGPHCMEGIDPSFSRRVKAGDILIGGKNFGTGSSREHAPIAIKAVGISCIVAVSFARIFYRNAINIGLPVFECPELVQAAVDGAAITADLKDGVFETAGVRYQAKAFPPYIQQIMETGGLVNFVRAQLR
ncbi:3-isopropylmalate dehydratase small subunit [Orrella sp. NBD-18]|uniref:3-isopropylmalate dehydratase small subunit n=1 Tax=Sheuella amnicola TaxID=2707330 RepID=A0A6B2R9E8_9BURK|nr:3-isopropylmalate dehydratase small subunit [Sheuella amnicola]NDY83895.1 3-isopropylmalate dehydratase small subunit [Sheuella amnicola]